MRGSTSLSLLIFAIVIGLSLSLEDRLEFNQTFNNNGKRSLSMNEDLEAITTIANGGTNSGTALTNGKLIYSASGALVEAPYLKSSDGKSLTVGDSGATGVSPISPVKLNLIGVASNLASGPHLNVYTSADVYPLLQELSFSHNNEAISFDTYWDGTSWKSSHAGSNFQIYKQYNQLQFLYGTGTTPGFTAPQYTSFYIDANGKTTFAKSIMLPGGDTYLDYYTEQSFNCSITPDLTYGAAYTVPSIIIKVTRLGKLVTYTFGGFTGSLTDAAAYLEVQGSCFPSSLLPDVDMEIPIVTKNTDINVGVLTWDYVNSWFQFHPIFGTYGTTTDVGTVGQQSFSFIKTA